MLDTVEAALARVLVPATVAVDALGSADAGGAPGRLPVLCTDVTDEARSRGTEPEAAGVGAAVDPALAPAVAAAASAGAFG